MLGRSEPGAAAQLMRDEHIENTARAWVQQCRSQGVRSVADFRGAKVFLYGKEVTGQQLMDGQAHLWVRPEIGAREDIAPRVAAAVLADLGLCEAALPRRPQLTLDLEQGYKPSLAARLSYLYLPILEVNLAAAFGLLLTRCAGVQFPPAVWNYAAAGLGCLIAPALAGLALESLFGGKAWWQNWGVWLTHQGFGPPRNRVMAPNIDRAFQEHPEMTVHYASMGDMHYRGVEAHLLSAEYGWRRKDFLPAEAPQHD